MRPVTMCAAHYAGDPQSMEGSRVRFRISDACVPAPTEIIARLHGHELLHGSISEFTDSGTVAKAFAVVEVVELAQPVVVPTRCLEEDK